MKCKKIYGYIYITYSCMNPFDYYGKNKIEKVEENHLLNRYYYYLFSIFCSTRKEKLL